MHTLTFFLTGFGTEVFSKINSLCGMRLIRMQILINTGKVIRPEFWRWNSYTQQACLYSFFFFFFCSRKASIKIHVDYHLLCFH